MNNIVVTTILVLLCLGLAACSTVINEGAGNLDKSLETSKDSSSKVLSYSNIKPEEAKKRLESEKNIILLDVRTQEEYNEKHIPNSLLIPVDVIETEAPAKLLDKNAEIFVYCRSGRRSITASEVLVRMGYSKVYNLGGIIDWPYETESGK